MTDKMREEFEATWADVMRGDEPPPGRKPARSRIDPERYAGDAAQFAWVWWQRSREPLVIELPDHYCYDRPGEAYPVIQDCREAIEAAGLKVSP
ncbi:hypothetical protein [Pseudomonas sp. Z1-6]|uniref:hypothetical protein n=1 Tax=Pseudomonas sp. Z1-6 TaxID=2817407 RepID=UPI003DA9FE2D